MLKQYGVKRLRILVLILSVFSVLFFGFLPSDTHASGGSSMADAQKLAMPSTTIKDTTRMTESAKPTHYWYSFKTSNYNGSTYTVILSNMEAELKGYFNVEIKDDTANSMTKLSGIGYGKTESIVAKSRSWWDQILGFKRNQTYYIDVEYERAFMADEDMTSSRYALIVKEHIANPAKVTVSSVKVGKKKLTVKYKKANYAERYQVAIKAKGGKWKIYNNGTKLSKTIKKLKKGKKYTVKVRAQRQCYNKWYTGSWSKAKTVKIK